MREKRKKEYDVKISEENGEIKITFKNRGIEYTASLKRDVLNMLLVGGERNYGLGRLKLEEMKKKKMKSLMNSNSKLPTR